MSRKPSVLKICTRCRFVFDDQVGWLPKVGYRGVTGIDPINCRLTHGYCPTCYEFVQKFHAPAKDAA